MIDQAKDRMEKAVEHLKAELAGVRTGRANPSLVSEVAVSAYGSRMKIMELATVTVPDPHLLVIAPWDKAIVGDINKAIMEANVGLQPQIDGDLVKLPIPQLTQERREEYLKLAAKKLEEARVAVRSIRHDELSAVKRRKDAHEISEDEAFRQEKILQETVDRFIEEIETIGRAKETELMQV